MDLVRRFCPQGHVVFIPHYVWTNFLHHTCNTCKKMYSHHKLTEHPPTEV